MLRSRAKLSNKEISDALTTSSYSRKYLYDGQEILAEYDESNILLGVLTHSTLRTDDVLAVDVKSTKLANSTGSYFYLKDGLGSITDIVDGSGTLIQHYSYSSFGKLLKTSDNSGVDITADPIVKTSYGYTNRELDVETGMMYYRARYYMPEIGRFISEDSHPGKKVLPGTIVNKYIYAGNSPTNFLDPDGRFIVTSLIVGALIGATIAAINGDNILEGAVIGAVAGFAGAYAATFVTATGAAGAIAGFVTGAVVGGVVGGLTGGLISIANGDSFDDGFTRGVGIGIAAGGVTGGLEGYTGLNLDYLAGEYTKYYARLAWRTLTSKKALIGYAVAGLTQLAADHACGEGKRYDAFQQKCVDDRDIGEDFPF